MIYSVRGKLIHSSTNEAVVECAGVGYHCYTTLSTLNQLPGLGSEVTLYTVLHVKEDGVTLYGFSTVAEKNCFQLLTSVSGIGPKGGLAILSLMTPDQVAMCVISGDHKSLTKAPGVGPKTAQRLVLELKDKMKTAGFSAEVVTVADTMQQTLGGGNLSEAMAALLALGYSQSEAAQAVAGCKDEDPVDAIIKQALKKLSGNRW